MSRMLTVLVFLPLAFLCLYADIGISVGLFEPAPQGKMFLVFAHIFVVVYATGKWITRKKE